MKHPIDELIAVMAKLRDPDGGCPWDLQQNFETIAPYTIEEAYEVADAIGRNDMADLQEELGDLLLQPVYHAQMAKEAGHFDINDVIRGITSKMIERHPHVFGDEKAKSASDVNVIWDKQKSKEKTRESVLDAVPKSLPALLRAKKLQDKAAKVGFEWKKLDDVLDKLEEELGELREAVQSGDLKDKQEEFGDLLFVLVNFARMNDIDAEDALRQCSDKFERRFRGIEKQFRDQKKDISQAPLEEMERMWVAEKNKEKKKS
ncbi:MAG: nucleoside triphosphate pyrophosphohydrolase [Alphaproteobacteria bacterium PRO2]|nr:nucleoside triphosphate pyrophosphohydrolase [Alphaproteobacteria bacterium PRO2]